MAKNNNLTDFLTCLANKIREKTGITSKINPQDFETKIDEISDNGTKMLDDLLQGNLIEIKNTTIKKMRSHALAYLTNLESVDFQNLTTLNSYAFSNCYKLKNVNLPKLETLGASCFNGCRELTEQIFISPVAIAISTFVNCIKLKKVDFTYITSTVASNTFQGCSEFDTFINRNTTNVVALSNKNAFSGTCIESGTGYIYVPAKFVEAYKTATNWITYADQIRAIEDYPEITGG